MPVIKVPQLGKTIQVSEGANLMKALSDNEVPVASSCLGDGVCGKCVLKVSGTNSCNESFTKEEAFLKEKHSWNQYQRACCQFTVQSDLVVESSYW